MVVIIIYNFAQNSSKHIMSHVNSLTHIGDKFAVIKMKQQTFKE